MKKLISLILINTLLISCTKTEYIEVDVKPKLEILVTDINNNPISGANVSLFITEEDFNSKQNLIKTSKTNTYGKVLFQKLDERIYFLYINKNELNNYYEIITFSEPLRKNEKRSISSIIR